MHLRSLTKYLAAAALFTAVTVHAQSTPPEKVSATLTVTQMRESAATLDVQVEEHAQAMKAMQGVARRDKDVVKLTCVNDRLVELKAQQNIFHDQRSQLNATAADATADVVRPIFQEISDTAESVKRLRGAAEACIGVPELYRQESDVEVTHPDFVDDPTIDDPFFNEVEGVEAPGYASPFS